MNRKLDTRFWAIVGIFCAGVVIANGFLMIEDIRVRKHFYEIKARILKDDRQWHLHSVAVGDAK